MASRRRAKGSPASTANLLGRFRRAISPGISGRSNDLLPITFFHYTTAAGVEGIVREKSIRATNFSFMNDPSEVQYGRELIEEVFSDRLNGATRDDEAFLEYVGINFTAEMLSEVYVCCFTKLQDDLSQWRAYGGSVAERYAIGFDPQEIQALAFSNANTLLVPVLYERDEQVEKIVDVLDRAIVFIRTNRPSTADLMSFGEAAAARLARLAPALKTLAYKPESEWRIVRWSKTNRLLTPRFDASRGVLRPYIDVPLPRQLPITALYVLAPRRKDLALKSAAMLLASANLLVSPVHSSIPFAE